MNEHAAKLAWAGLLTGVCVYEYYAPEGQLLSEAVDRGLEHPVGKVLIPLAIGVTALHLLNILRPEVDPIHQISVVASRARL